MEDTKVEALLEESVRLGRQNAVELHKIRKNLFWMLVLRVVTWLIVAGVPIFIYLHLVKPSFEEVFTSVTGFFNH